MKLSKSQLIWRSRRGMYELDMLFSKFCRERLNDLPDHQLKLYGQLLSYPDDRLYAWFFGQEQPHDDQLHHLISDIIHTYFE